MHEVGFRKQVLKLQQLLADPIVTGHECIYSTKLKFQRMRWGHGDELDAIALTLVFSYSLSVRTTTFYILTDGKLVPNKDDWGQTLDGDHALYDEMTPIRIIARLHLLNASLHEEPLGV